MFDLIYLPAFVIAFTIFSVFTPCTILWDNPLKPANQFIADHYILTLDNLSDRKLLMIDHYCMIPFGASLVPIWNRASSDDLWTIVLTIFKWSIILSLSLTGTKRPSTWLNRTISFDICGFLALNVIITSSSVSYFK